METTDWSKYGHCSGNPKCTDCMVHSGYEPSAVAATFGSLSGLLKTAKLTLLGPGKGRGPEPPDSPGSGGGAGTPQPVAADTPEFEVELPVLS